MAHGPEMPIIPGFQSEKKRPWWAAALLGGVGIGLTLLFGLGFAGRSAEGAQHAPVNTSGTVAPPGTLSLDERLNRIETALGLVKDEVAELRAHLPKK